MKYLHTMVRVTNLDESLAFYRDHLGLEEINRIDVEAGRFSLVFLAAKGDEEAQVELTHNWDPEPYSGGRNFGHLAYRVEDIYATCQGLQDAGVIINTHSDGYIMELVDDLLDCGCDILNPQDLCNGIDEIAKECLYDAAVLRTPFAETQNLLLPLEVDA